MEIRIFYKIYFDNEKNEENINKKSYYFIKESICEKNHQLTIEQIKNIIFKDGFNSEYKDLIQKFKYRIIKKDEEPKNILNKNDIQLEDLNNDDNGVIQFEENNVPYKLCLHIIINSEKNEERTKNKINDIKKKEKENIKNQENNIRQMLYELNELKKIQSITELTESDNQKFKYIKKDDPCFDNDIQLSKNISNSQIIKSSKEFNKYNSDEDCNAQKVSQTEVASIKIKNRYEVNYFFSSQLGYRENNKNKKYYSEDYSYYEQSLIIYNVLKKNKKISADFNYKQINELISLDNPTDIIHIRTDFYKDTNEEGIYFLIEREENENDSNVQKYYLNNLFKNKIFDSEANIKLLIISSENVDIIKNYFNNLKINKIYINHLKENEKEENIFIGNLYKNYFDSGDIKESFNNALKKIEEKKQYNFEKVIENNRKLFEQEGKGKMNSKTKLKNLLNHEMMYNSYYIFGRNEELYQNLKYLREENAKGAKICIYGERGVGKKSFAKKLGFSLYERNIVDAVYYLEIYSINNNTQSKINLMIDEICLYYNHNKIMIIFYFDDIIDLNKLNILKNIIFNHELYKDNNYISYLYVFTLEKPKKFKKYIDNLPNLIELDHFNYNQNNIFIDLFNYCMRNNKDFKKEKYIKLFCKDLILKIKEELNLLNEEEINNLKKEINEEISNDEENVIEECFNKNKNIDENIIKNYEKIIFIFYLIQEKIGKIKNLKINDIFLLSSYINYYQAGNNIPQLLIDDSGEIKKKIIEKLIEEGNKKNTNIFSYLYYLSSGIGKTLFKILLNDYNEDNFNFIKENLRGLIIVEHNGNEEIYRLDSSNKEIIQEYINKNDINLLQNILINYFFIFRKLLKNYKNSNLFNACIDNNFWRKEEIKKFEEEMENKQNDKNFNYFFNKEIDSNNIYNIIKNIDKKTYNYYKYISLCIGDISITLPTLLFLNSNYYLDYLIIELVELFENKFKSFLKKEKDENLLKIIKELILRLGIFKYYITKNRDFFDKSLKIAELNDIQSINKLNEEAKYEYYLIQLYDCIIKRGKNIKELTEKCNSFNKYEDNQRLANLLEYNKANQIKFFCYFKNPLKDELNIDELNNNFYLIQSLMNKNPSNYEIDFQCFDEKVDINNDLLEKLKNVRILYLGSHAFNNKVNIEDNILKELKNKIKILILNFQLDSDDFLLNGFNNIIYLSQDKITEKMKDEKDYILNIYIKFIIDFFSKLTSNLNYFTIKEVFKQCEKRFNRELSEKTSIQGGIIKIRQKNEYDTFEFGNLNRDEDINIYKKDVNDMYDDYKYNKTRNIYYRKNPFSEEMEKNENKRYRKYMKLPEIETLDFNLSKEGIKDIKKLIDKIENNKIVNIFGDNSTSILGYEICKYFYISGKFQRGIFIINYMNIEEISDGLKDLEENEESILDKNNKNNQYLIMINATNLGENKDDINKDNILQNEFNANFVFCSKNKINIDCLKYDLNKKEFIELENINDS